MLTAILVFLIGICILQFCTTLATERLLGVTARVHAQMVDAMFKNTEKFDEVLACLENISAKLDPVYSLTERLEKQRHEAEKNSNY